MREILSLRNVTFENLIKYPDISINACEATFIVGESGCGKSSLLKLFNATVSNSSGEIFYNGKSILEIDTIKLRREVLLVSQNIFLFDNTIEENFKEYYSYLEKGLISKDKIKEYIDLCRIDFPINADCTLMSGGERQRVFIAICLSLMPKVIMLDEPTSALDEKTSDEMLLNIKNFCKSHDITLLVVSHDKSLTEKYADNVITLERDAKP
ncbi:MAG: ABC transporter ATP-binding protein [Oscillospiraceae bacterium]